MSRFSVQAGGEKTLGVPGNWRIKKGNGVIFLDLHGKMNGRLLIARW